MQLITQVRLASSRLVPLNPAERVQLFSSNLEQEQQIGQISTGPPNTIVSTRQIYSGSRERALICAGQIVAHPIRPPWKFPKGWN